MYLFSRHLAFWFHLPASHSLIDTDCGLNSSVPVSIAHYHRNSLSDYQCLFRFPCPNSLSCCSSNRPKALGSYISHSFHFFHPLFLDQLIWPYRLPCHQRKPENRNYSIIILFALWFSTWDKICVSWRLGHIPQGHLNIWNECVSASALWLDREVLAIENLTPLAGGWQEFLGLSLQQWFHLVSWLS